MSKLSEFQKKKDFLVCVDSDGCAMDTMTSKHETAFCPRLIDVYGLHEVDRDGLITKEWMRLNLYSATRGVNRFKGLAHTLEFLHEHGVEIPGREEVAAWVSGAKVLSNDALKEAIAQGGGAPLEKALEWSLAVNATVAQMSAADDSHPFPGCKETLERLRPYCDTAVVSAANSEAVDEEWKRCGIAASMDLLMGQDSGSKAFCLQELVKKGYGKDHILMCGDALGDLDAAQKAGTLFYPILVGREAESWARLTEEAFPRFLAGTYAGEYEASLIREQKKILA